MVKSKDKVRVTVRVRVWVIVKVSGFYNEILYIAFHIPLAERDC